MNVALIMADGKRMTMVEMDGCAPCSIAQRCLVACPNNRILAEHLEITCELGYGSNSLTDAGEPMEVVFDSDASVSTCAGSDVGN